MTPLSQALAYAAAGWPVFPCKPDQKAPDTAHGFKDATTDPAVIRAWWPPSSRRNVAIATGSPGPDVLDVDVKPDGSGFAAFNRLKQAGLLTGARALIRTPSGGLHAYYAGTSQPSGRLARSFLDFKAAGGYVLAPPSVVGGKPYELLDKRQASGRIDWQAVRRLLDAPKPRYQAPRDDGDITGLIEWVARQNKQGNRHDPLKWAAFRLLEAGQLDDAAAAELVGASVRAGHNERDAWACVRSIQRKAAG